MQTSPLAEESLPDNIAQAEAMLVRYDALLQATQATVVQLRAAENPQHGIYHAAEIHKALQLKHQYTVERQFVQNRLARLRMADTA